MNANIRAVTGSGDTGNHVARVAADAVAGDIRAAGYAAGWAEGRHQAAEEIAQAVRDIRLHIQMPKQQGKTAIHEALTDWQRRIDAAIEEVGRE